MDGGDGPPDGSASGFGFGGSYEESAPMSFPGSDQSDPPSDPGPPGRPYGYGYGYGPPLLYLGRGPELYNNYSSSGRPASRTVNNGRRSGVGCAACCCGLALNTVWVFVAIAIIFGVYTSETLQLGPNSSLLINPNPFFVDSIKVVELDAVEGSMLYGFHKRPPLDAVASWSEIHDISLPGDTHKEWVYYLNKGSQINVSFTFNSPSSPPIVLVIARGKDDLNKWLKNPSDTSAIFSWHVIHENGSIQVSVSTSSAYYIALGNLKSTVVEVQLHTRIKAFLYNTTESYYKCTPLEGSCSFQLSFMGGNAAVLTSPGRNSDVADGDWSFTLSYGPRWSTYSVGVGGITVSVLAIYLILKLCRSTNQERRIDQSGDLESDRKPLLSRKDNEKHAKHSLSRVFRDRKRVKDDRNIDRDECTICFDAPRDCFFIPCGHSAACSDCATRLVEAYGTCPVCRQPIKDVRKIYTV